MDSHARLLDHLAEHDEPCPICGYSLLGARDHRCPECSAPLELGVRSPQRLFGPWVFAIVSIALGLGFDGVIALLMTIPLFTEPGAPIAIKLLYAFFALASALQVVAIVWLLRRRSTLQRLRPPRQWTTAWVVFGGVLIVHASAGLLFFDAMR